MSASINACKYDTKSATECAMPVPGAGVSLSSCTPSAPASSFLMSCSEVALCTWLYVYCFQIACIANQNLCPYLALVASSMLAMSVNMSWGMLIAIPYVAILAAFNCISSMLTLTFFWKSKVRLITSNNCSSTSVVDGQLAPLMADAITAKSV